MDGISQDIGGYVAVAIAFFMAGVAVVGARRFAKRKEAEGLWDAKGPLHPTDPPPGWLNPRYWAPPAPTIVSEPHDPGDIDASFNATVFVSSLIGYTAKSETMKPEEVAAWANETHEQVTKAVLDEGGVPVKYIGDGFLAYFDGENTERRAVNAAIAARDSAAHPIAIGLAMGTIHRALIGYAEHARPDVMGAPVNRAFRIEQWAAGTNTRIGVMWDDALALEDEFVIVQHDRVALKGLPEQVRAFEVVKRRS